MKTIGVIFLLILITAFSNTAYSQSDDLETEDWETYQVIELLLTITEPAAPVIYENSVIFSADSGLRRVGVAFAHENFSKIYWFKKLFISQDALDAPIPPGKKVPDPYKDSGIQFFVYQVPEYIRELEYRLVINGLWIVDPSNSVSRKDPVSGLNMSVLSMPRRTPIPNPLNGLPEGLDFYFNGPPGETVTVAGNFNGWDPFMYELKEYPEGIYTLKIPLPPGTYHYIFFHRGRRYTDPHNPNRIYTKEGSAASVIVIP